MLLELDSERQPHSSSQKVQQTRPGQEPPPHQGERRSSVGPAGSRAISNECAREQANDLPVGKESVALGQSDKHIRDSIGVIDCEVGDGVLVESYEAVCPVDDVHALDRKVAGAGGMFGRLKRCIPFWKELGASEFVIRVLKHGYRLLFIREPPTQRLSNQNSCSSNVEFVDKAVQALLDCGSAIETKESRLKCISPLGVVQGSSKLRLILDLRCINRCLAKFKFKLDDVRLAAKLYGMRDYVVTFDLKSGYHHVDVAEEHWKYLGFEWKGKFYCFCSLPFGLSTAPHLFNKLVRVMVKYWRVLGIKCMMFFDDGSAGASPYSEAIHVAGILRDTLKRAGWVVNEEKSCWKPSQTPVILGFVLDLVQGRAFVTDRRLKRFKDHMKYLRTKQRPNAKECAKLAGFIVSMSFAIGPVARLRTRGLYELIINRSSWYERVEWTRMAKEEVDFWWQCFEQFHGALLFQNQTTVAVISTWSDASDVAWGGFTVSHGEMIARGNWPQEVKDAAKSSTWRELRATELVLESLVDKLAQKECRHRTDNQAAVWILQVGSRVPELHEIAVRIFSLCRQYCIKLVPEWVPREENERADYFSKIIDSDDWKLSRDVFQWLDRLWGPHSIDCFASDCTKQIDRYCSRWWNPGCIAVDAFTLSWKDENAWLCPPIHLIGDVVLKVRTESCHGTIILPEWHSAWWWPWLFSTDDNGQNVVKSTIYLPRKEGLFVAGTCSWNWFNEKYPKCEVLAIRLCSVAECSCGMGK